MAVIAFTQTVRYVAWVGVLPMNYAGATPDPTVSLGVVACAGLVCLFVASAIVFVVVLARRGRKG